jgi:hypothetical protein
MESSGRSSMLSHFAKSFTLPEATQKLIVCLHLLDSFVDENKSSNQRRRDLQRACDLLIDPILDEETIFFGDEWNLKSHVLRTLCTYGAFSESLKYFRIKSIPITTVDEAVIVLHILMQENLFYEAFEFQVSYQIY